MQNKEAIIIGATGLVGSHLLQRALDDARFSAVTLLGRRHCGREHPKLTEHLVDFSAPGDWEHLVQGDVLFLCLGTTRAKAGGKKAQYLVDHTYQFRVAEAAAKNGVHSLLLVSSAGARLNSPFFYMRMKAELERDIQALPIRRKVFIRPGALTGPRTERRTGEKVGVWLFRTLNRLGILRAHRPIHGDEVARALINASFAEEEGVHIHELQEVFVLSRQG